MMLLRPETSAGDEFGRHAPADENEITALPGGLPITNG